MKINDMGGAMEWSPSSQALHAQLVKNESVGCSFGVKLIEWFTGPPCTTGEKRKRGLQPWSEANRVELL